MSFFDKMDSPKYFFRHTLNRKKGKVIDNKLASKLASQLEQNVLDFLYNEGFILVNAETRAEISVTGFSEKLLTVTSSSNWQESKEYDTLLGAVKCTEKMI